MEEEKKIEKNNETIVPSYAKKQESNNGGKKKKSNFVINKKRLLIFIIAIILIVLLIFGIVKIVNVVKYSKYDEYSETLDNYGISEMFDNGKSTSSDSVTKSEALKVIISSILNVKEINIIVHEEKYQNEDWVNYAVSEGIIKESDVNESNASSKITFAEFVTYFANARVKLLKQQLNTSIYPNYSDTKKLEPEQLYAVSDLIYNNVLENSTGKLDPTRKLSKGELNKITADIIEKYNIMIPEDKKFNVSEEKVPENSNDYSFIVHDVDKEVYEKAYIKSSEEKFKKPKEVYAEYRDAYDSIETIIKDYFDAVLNVNYNTINVEDFMAAIEDCSLFEPELTYIRKYVQYVKDNKIILSGSAEPQTPIIYFDGRNYRLRTKISFKIENSNTKKNLLYLDDQIYDRYLTYDKDEYSFYVDVRLDTPSNIKMMYLWEESVYEMLRGEAVEGITAVDEEEAADEIDDIGD